MAAILCLAHFCDTHGPTPLMTCEGSPISCSSCYDDNGVRTQSNTTRIRSTELGESNRSSNPKGKSQSTILDQRGLTQMSLGSHAATSTPPESPRLETTSSIPQIQVRRDSSFRRTYDDNDRKRAIPCENCALTIPIKMKEQLPDGAPGSPMKNGQPFVGSSPVLRTRVPYVRVCDSSEATSPNSQSSSATSNSLQNSDLSTSSDEYPLRSGTTPMTRTNTNSTVSSVLSSDSSSASRRSFHSHYIEYTSSHDPQTSQSFSALRASCLRTLSCETLPPSSSGTVPTTFSAPQSLRSLLPNNVTGNGGPLFFGDSAAGYTTAFIFRVPDPHARGRRRIYAFICLTNVKEGKAMQAFGWLSKTFRELATWIQGLAEVEADRVDSSITNGISDGPMRSTSNNSAHQLYKNDSVNSLRSGVGSTVAGSGAFGGLGSGGFPRRSGMNSINGGGPYMNSPKNRGLAELVGRPDFFLDLHARFVALSAQMSKLGM